MVLCLGKNVNNINNKKKSLQSFLGLTNYIQLYTIIVHKHIVYENYCRKIKITYGQKHMNRLLAILNNILVVKVVFPILTTIKRHIFTQTLVLTKIRKSFY